jgi:hypothetical protein
MKIYTKPNVFQAPQFSRRDLFVLVEGQTRLLAERAARGIALGEQSICNLELIRRRLREGEVR